MSKANSFHKTMASLSRFCDPIQAAEPKPPVDIAPDCFHHFPWIDEVLSEATPQILAPKQSTDSGGRTL